MSNERNEREALATQLAHTVTIINQQGLNFYQYKVMHDGYLPALVQRIKLGKMMSLGDFQKSIGLGILEPLSEIAVPPLLEPFDPRNHFPVDIPDTAKIKVSGKIGSENGVSHYLYATL